MDRFRKALKRSSSLSYEALPSDPEHSLHPNPPSLKPFSWLEYFIFLLLGLSGLWAWYMPSHFRRVKLTISDPYTFPRRHADLSSGK